MCSRPCLILPNSLSKQARAWWHQHAKKAGLSSESKVLFCLRVMPRSEDTSFHHMLPSCLQGFGEARQIYILPAGSQQDASQPCARPDNQKNCDINDPGSPDSQQHLEHAKRVYSWCQEDGPSYWRYSHSEIRQMLSSDHALPSDIQQLIAKRCAKSLWSHRLSPVSSMRQTSPLGKSVDCARLSGHDQQYWHCACGSAHLLTNCSPRMVLAVQHTCLPIVSLALGAWLCREQSQQLAEHIEAGRTAAAVALLEANPQLAWMRDKQTGDYPMHMACRQVSPAIPCARVACDASAAQAGVQGQ